MSKGFRRPSLKLPKVKVEEVKFERKNIEFLILAIRATIKTEPILDRIWDYVIDGNITLCEKLAKYGETSKYWGEQKSAAQES